MGLDFATEPKNLHTERHPHPKDLRFFYAPDQCREGMGIRSDPNTMRRLYAVISLPAPFRFG